MLLFSDRASGFHVYRTSTDWPKRLSDRACTLCPIAEIDIVSDVWCVKFDQTRRPAGYPDYNDLLDNAEKRSIIRLLDRLNKVTGRKHDKYLARWHEIIGLDPPKVWVDIVVDDYKADNPWSDTVAKIEALRRTDNTLT